jgi:hypothetical protein
MHVDFQQNYKKIKGFRNQFPASFFISETWAESESIDSAFEASNSPILVLLKEDK